VKVDERQEGSITVLTPRGAVIGDEVSFVRSAVERLPLKARLVISMKDVPYLDSSALEFLVDLNESLAASTQRLKFADTQPVTREIFHLTDLLDEFEFYDSVEDAVRSFL
jgi:anti-anti-sigma factor